QHRVRERRAGLPLARLDQRIEQRGVAEILLDPHTDGLVLAVQLRYRQAGRAERVRERDERAVLLVIRTHRTDGRAQVVADQPVIGTIRAVPRDLENRTRWPAESSGI